MHLYMASEGLDQTALESGMGAYATRHIPLWSGSYLGCKFI